MVTPCREEHNKEHHWQNFLAKWISLRQNNGTSRSVWRWAKTEWHVLSRDFTQFTRQRGTVKADKGQKTNRMCFMCSRNHGHRSQKIQTSRVLPKHHSLPKERVLDSGEEGDITGNELQSKVTAVIIKSWVHVAIFSLLPSAKKKKLYTYTF